MALPIRPNNPNIPIPNTTFSSPLNAYVNGPYFPVVMGTGIDINTPGKVADLNNAGLLEFNGAVGDVNLLAGPGIAVTEVDNDFTIDNTGVISLIAGANIQISGSNGTYTISSTDAQTGTVTSVGTGVGLTGGPITTSGTISLDVSGTTPGSYTYADITVDAYGRVTAASNGVAPVTTVTGTAPVQVTGTAPSLTVAVAPSSTTAPGVVQLVDALNSTSTTQALTAAQGKVLQDQITALTTASNLTFAGTIDGSTGFMVSVTTEAAGLATPFVVGQAMPAASAENEDYFTIVSVAGTMTPPGGSSTATTVGDWFLSTGSNYQFLDTGFNPPYASTTEAGIVELADNAETQAGTDATLVVTPAGLQSKVSDSVSTASSTSIASSQAVKDAYDAAAAAQTDATQALSDAAAAQADATQALADAAAAGADVGDLSTLTTTDKSSAVAAINEVNAAASNAQTDATQALADASAAQADATQALADAAAAQATADAAIPCAALLAKGDLISASAASAPVALSVGADGQVLAANSACSEGLEWIAAPSSGIPCSTITAKGDIIVGSAANTPVALPVGSYNQVLLADSGCATGLKWGGLPQASVAGLGVVYGCTTNSTTCNTSLGYYSLAYTSATCTIVLGNSSMIGSSGDSHIAIGVGIAATQGAASCNVVIGNRIGGGNFQNSAQNVIVGQYAACGCLSGSNKNVILGANAATTLNLACNNVAIGYGVAPPSSSSKCTLAIGYDTGCHWLTGDCTKAIQPGAGIIDCAGSCGTAGQVLSSNGANAVEWITAGGGGGSPATPTVAGIVLGCTTASNVALGCNAFLSGAGVANIAIGCCSLSSGVSGNDNIGIGFLAAKAATSGNSNIGIGGYAAYNVTTAAGNIAIGSLALGSTTSGDYNLGVGYQALYALSAGCLNTVLGNSAGTLLTSGSQNVAIGSCVQFADPTGSCQLAIGFSGTDNWLTGNSTKAIQPGAGIIDCAGSCGTAGQVLQSNGSNAIQWATPQTSPFITYVTSQVTYTAGTPLQVATWQGLGSAIQGTVTISTGYQTPVFWDFYIAGDATNLNSGWVQGQYWPTDPANGAYQGTWSVDFPVYPDPNASKWVIYFNPTQNSFNPESFTFFYRLIGGQENLAWSI